MKFTSLGCSQVVQWAPARESFAMTHRIQLVRMGNWRLTMLMASASWITTRASVSMIRPYLTASLWSQKPVWKVT